MTAPETFAARLQQCPLVAILRGITPEQAETGKWVLLIISVHVAMNFPFSVFGGVVTGFQRQHVNGFVAIASSLVRSARLSAA